MHFFQDPDINSNKLQNVLLFSKIAVSFLKSIVSIKDTTVYDFCMKDNSTVWYRERLTFYNDISKYSKYKYSGLIDVLKTFSIKTIEME